MEDLPDGKAPIFSPSPASGDIPRSGSRSPGVGPGHGHRQGSRVGRTGRAAWDPWPLSATAWPGSPLSPVGAENRVTAAMSALTATRPHSCLTPSWPPAPRGDQGWGRDIELSGGDRAEMGVDLLGGCAVLADQRCFDLPDVGDLESRGGGQRHRRERVGGDVGEACCPQQSRQGPSVGEIDAPLGQQLEEPGAYPVGAVLDLPPGLDAGERLEARRRSPRSGACRRAAARPPCVAGPRPAVGTWTSTRRACTRSNPGPGGSSVATSCRRTSTFPGSSVLIQPTSRSVATTEPVGPTRSASSLGTPGPPAPTSQHRHPAATPIPSTCRMVTPSNSADSASKRVPAVGAVLSRR